MRGLLFSPLTIDRATLVNRLVPPCQCPAGRISEGEVIAQIWILLLGGIGVAAVLDLWAGEGGSWGAAAGCIRSLIGMGGLVSWLVFTAGRHQLTCRRVRGQLAALHM